MSSGARPIRVDDFHKKVEQKIGSANGFGIRPIATTSPLQVNRGSREYMNKSGMYLDTDEEDNLRINKLLNADSKFGDRYAAK